MRRKPALFYETKKIKIDIVSDPWEIIETRRLGYPRNIYSYPRIVYMTVEMVEIIRYCNGPFHDGQEMKSANFITFLPTHFWLKDHSKP